MWKLVRKQSDGRGNPYCTMTCGHVQRRFESDTEWQQLGLSIGKPTTMYDTTPLTLGYSGIHACPNPLDCFLDFGVGSGIARGITDLADAQHTVLLEVELSGEVLHGVEDDHAPAMSCARTCTPIREVSGPDLLRLLASTPPSRHVAVDAADDKTILHFRRIKTYDRDGGDEYETDTEAEAEDNHDDTELPPPQWSVRPDIDGRVMDPVVLNAVSALWTAGITHKCVIDMGTNRVETYLCVLARGVYRAAWYSKEGTLVRTASNTHQEWRDGEGKLHRPRSEGPAVVNIGHYTVQNKWYTHGSLDGDDDHPAVIIESVPSGTPIQRQWVWSTTNPVFRLAEDIQPTGERCVATFDDRGRLHGSPAISCAGPPQSCPTSDDTLFWRHKSCGHLFLLPNVLPVPYRYVKAVDAVHGKWSTATVVTDNGAERVLTLGPDDGRVLVVDPVSGDREWFLNGRKHDGPKGEPAVVHPGTGLFTRYENDILHGWSQSGTNGILTRFAHGRPHSTRGPAVFDPVSRRTRYYLAGVQLSPAAWRTKLEEETTLSATSLNLLKYYDGCSGLYCDVEVWDPEPLDTEAAAAVLRAAATNAPEPPAPPLFRFSASAHAPMQFSN